MTRLSCLALLALLPALHAQPPAGPLAPRPPEPPPVTFVDPFDSGPTLLPAAGNDEGLFFDAELTLAFPSLRQRLPASAGGQAPQVDLDATVAPAFEVGHRLAGGQGFFALGYRFLNAEGRGDAVQDGIPFSVRTRASVNVFDVDYGMPAAEFAPGYTYSWRLGGRIAELYYDTRGASGEYVRQASDRFFGSGAHARLDVERRVAVLPGLALFGRLDGSVLVGQVQQRYRQEFGPATFTQTDHNGRTVPVLNAQAGVSYVPPGLSALKLTAGYTYEEWFHAGSLGLNSDGMIATSRGGLLWHGAFLRGRLDF